jgi:hypothetical protein
LKSYTSFAVLPVFSAITFFLISIPKYMNKDSYRQLFFK